MPADAEPADSPTGDRDAERFHVPVDLLYRMYRPSRSGAARYRLRRSRFGAITRISLPAHPGGSQRLLSPVADRQLVGHAAIDWHERARWRILWERKGG